ncbi:MAG: PDZ domain-containing protein [Planctomycetes bacterium]|nr:PDZ domain-containing protein [Planctomycetota bacterium]
MLPRSALVLALPFAAGLSLAALPAQKGDGGNWPFGAPATASSIEWRDLFNLGALGAKAWDADRPEPSGDRTSGRRTVEGGNDRGPDVGPKRLVVRALFDGGPAQKAGLRLGDVILGVDDTTFADGCFAPLAAALQRAEATDGKLVLRIERAGKPLPLSVKLAKVGPVAKAPETGRMRQQLLDDALAWLGKRQVGGGFAETLGGSNGAVVQTCLAGLAWIGGGSSLAKGKHRENLAAAQQFVLRGLTLPDRMGEDGGANWDQTTWGYAHAAIFLGELQLAGGGKKPSADLQRIADTLCARQEVSGGYGHGPGGKNALGYIELNILAGYVACGLSVAQQAGCKVDAGTVDKLFGYTDASSGADGGVGYATGPGQKGMGNIGRTAGMWLAARGLGRADQPGTVKMGDYVRAHIADTMGGHASLQQHILLAGIAASALGKEAADAFWSGGLQRDLTLARAPDGSLQPRPWHESLLLQSNTDVSCGEVWTTASWAIVLGAHGEPGKGGFLGWCARKR